MSAREEALKCLRNSWQEIIQALQAIADDVTKNQLQEVRLHYWQTI